MAYTEDLLSRPVVVFSRNYLPVSQITVRRAIALLVTERAEAMPYNNEDSITVHSPTMALHIPRQIRLTIGHVQRNWNIPPVNRREVLRRDRHTCQYCGSTRHLTLDHIIPRSKGGQNTWTNVVTACSRCNSVKGDRTPQQAGMPLKKKPKPPVHPVLAFAAEYWREQAGSA